MGRELKRPEVFSYHDGRALIRDLIDFEKAQNPGFSIRLLANKSGIATGFLPMYLSGKRRISLETAKKLTKALPLSSKEGQFFLLLVELDNATNSHERIEILGEIQKLEVYREVNQKEFEVHRYLKSWFCVAIRELSLLPDFQLDATWIKKRLRRKVALTEIKEALEFLKHHNFIVERNGRYFQNPDKDLECIDGVFKISLSAFHRQMLDLAASSIGELNAQKRIVIGQTIPISFKDFEAAKSILNNALDQIQKLQAGEGNGDQVYHFALAGFPLTQDVSDSEESK